MVSNDEQPAGQPEPPRDNPGRGRHLCWQTPSDSRVNPSRWPTQLRLARTHGTSTNSKLDFPVGGLRYTAISPPNLRYIYIYRERERKTQRERERERGSVLWKRLKRWISGPPGTPPLPPIVNRHIDACGKSMQGRWDKRVAPTYIYV